MEANKAAMSPKAVGSGSADNILEKVIVKPDHPHFQGHFDTFPILPAVSQVEMAVNSVQRILGRKIDIVEVSRGKFLAKCLPGAVADLAVTVDRDLKTVTWVLSNSEETFSKGSFVYAERL
ncbi:MAG: hypothetical protein AB7T49_17285 [Oligoflexales bacterium]